MCVSQGNAQSGKWGRMKSLQFYKKNIARQKSPEKLKAHLLEGIDKSRAKFKIFFSLLLGDHYERAGNFADAEKIYLDAYAQAKLISSTAIKSYLPNFSGTIYDAFDRLAYFYLKTGNLRRAEQLFQESLAIRNSIFPARSVYRVHPIVGMGSLYFRKGQYEKTYALFNKAIKMINRATTTHYDYDNINRLFLNDLAELCMALGKNDEALIYINKLALASSGVGKYNSRIGNHLQIASIFELKARYFVLTRNFRKAQEYLDRANHYNPPNLTVSDVKFKLLKTEALLHWYAGNLELANGSFKKLVTSYRDHISRNFIAMSEYEKEQFYNTLKNDFNLFNAYVIDIHHTTPKELYEEMYSNIINTKALLLNNNNRKKNKIIQSGDSLLIGKLHQWEQAKARLSSQYFEKANAENINTLEKNIENLEKQINQSSDLFPSKESNADWHQIKEILKEGETALEIVRINVVDGKKKNGYAKNSGLSDSVVYAVLMLKSNSSQPEFFVIPEGNLLENKYLSFYSNAIFAQIEDKLSYDHFWAPIRRNLNGAKRIFISPDGVFNQVNLNTMRNPVSGKYLIDEMDVVNLTNTADLLREKVDQPAIKEAVLFGRPSYKLEANSTAGGEAVLQAYGLRNILTDELENFKDQIFLDLPGTEVEINQIEETLKSRGVFVHTFKGDAALEERVKSVKKPSILHIATHGFFVEDSASLINPMIRSGVIMAGVQNLSRPGTEDGILTAYEATNLDLENTDIVVLSACQTGLGEIRNGEGVYGLQRAIIVAGANNLLMSLWKVDDEATAALMVALYQSWKGGNNLLAFREAQLSLREKYPEPFYWGAFIMLGN